jgi:hypothetical protein
MKVAHHKRLRAVGLVPKYLRASLTSDGEPTNGREAATGRGNGRLKAGMLEAKRPAQLTASAIRNLQRMSGPRYPVFLFAPGSDRRRIGVSTAFFQELI